MTESQEAKFVQEIENAMHLDENGKIPAKDFFTIGQSFGLKCREVVELKAKHFAHLMKGGGRNPKRVAKKAKAPKKIAEDEQDEQKKVILKDEYVPVVVTPVIAPKKKAKNYNTPAERLKEAQADLEHHENRLQELQNPVAKKGKWFYLETAKPEELIPTYKKLIDELKKDIKQIKKELAKK